MNPIIKSKLDSYGPIKSDRDEKNALKEIMQRICLKGLQRHGFFEHAAFYGDTALRIMYGLERFSEDLDFCLDKKNPNFKWIAYKEAVEEELRFYGFDAKFESKNDEVEDAIGSAFIKQSTFKGLIIIESRTKSQKAELIRIKLELDKRNPPGATFENKILTQP